MGLGGVAIAVPPYVIHPKTAVLGRAGGVNSVLFAVAFLGKWTPKYILLTPLLIFFCIFATRKLEQRFLPLQYKLKK